MGAKGVFFDSLWVDNPSGPRWQLALDLLKDGKGFVFRGIGLRYAKTNDLLVTVPSRWRVNPEWTRDSIVMSQLQEAQRILQTLEEESQEFSTLVKGKTVEYQLVDDLYGYPLFSLRNSVFRRLKS